MSSVHKARSRGAPRADQRLGRAAVVDRATVLVDRDGIEGFSLRALARDLGVGPGALYNHVSGRDDLLDEVTVAFLGEFEIPADREHWATWLRAFAVDMRDRMAARPHLAELMIARAPAVGNRTDHQVRFFATMRRHGLNRADAHLAWHMVYTAVVGTVAQQRARPPDPADTFGVVLDVTLEGLAARVGRGTDDQVAALLEAHRHAHAPEPEH